MTRLKHILLCVALLAADASASEPAERRGAFREEPEYPRIAGKMNLHGKVRLKVWISPDGTVRRLEYVGGHPLLVESALKAVKRWKYEAAGKESTMVVELKF